MPASSYYQTALEMGRGAPTHIANKDDQQRVQAYWTYSEIYDNVSTVFEAVLRDDTGDELSRRYIPSGKKIVEAIVRYLCCDMQWMLSALPGTTVTDEELAEFRGVFESWLAREEFVSKFSTTRREAVKLADALLHLTVDGSKPEGERISIDVVSADRYFPWFDETRPGRVLGAYLVDLIKNDDDEEIARRIAYVKDPVSGNILTQLSFWASDKWDDRAPLTADDLEPADPPTRFAQDPLMQAWMTGTVLPVKTIPLYPFRYSRRKEWGVSALQGLETLIAGINQSVTDQDLSAALFGIGMYWTTAGPPRDPATGDTTEWIVTPGGVWELQGDNKKVGRLEGVTSFEPMLQHQAVLDRGMREGVGVSDAAVGRVDTEVAKSGVALAMEMAPILSRNAETEEDFASKIRQLMYDLFNQWWPAFEGGSWPNIVIDVEFGDPLPVDRPATLEEILAMLKAQLVTTEWARQEIAARLGYTFPDGMLEAVLAEQQAMLDATGQRLGSEAATTGDGAPTA